MTLLGTPNEVAAALTLPHSAMEINAFNMSKLMFIRL